MDKYSLLDIGDLVRHKNVGCLGVVVKVYPFQTHYDNRILVHWSVGGERVVNVHNLLKVSQ